MSKREANYITGADALDGWKESVLTGAPPVLYRAGAGELARIEIGPGLVTLFGGAPGAGKTAFVMQLIIDALRLNPELRALVLNVEMPPGVLLDRQLARLSGIPLNVIRYRKLGTEHADRIDQAMNTLEALSERLCLVRAPFDLSNAAASADEFKAGLIALDYIQRIAPPGEHDKCGSVDATMSYLRLFADQGLAVIVVSAVSRTKDAKGRASYGGEFLNLASFRESSELEFGADDAFILTADGEGDSMLLKHLKSRHGEAKDLALQFDRPRQSFKAEEKPAAAPKESKAQKAKLKSTLTALWNRAQPAADDDDDEDAEGDDRP